MELTEKTLIEKLSQNNYSEEIIISLNLETIKLRAAEEGKIRIEYSPSRHAETIEASEAVKIYNKIYSVQIKKRS